MTRNRMYRYILASILLLPTAFAIHMTAQSVPIPHPHPSPDGNGGGAGGGDPFPGCTPGVSC